MKNMAGSCEKALHALKTNGEKITSISLILSSVYSHFSDICQKPKCDFPNNLRISFFLSLF